MKDIFETDNVIKLTDNVTLDFSEVQFVPYTGQTDAPVVTLSNKLDTFKFVIMKREVGNEN